MGSPGATWLTRAEDFVRAIVVDAYAARPNDPTFAINALAGATTRWKALSEYSGSPTGLRALGKARAAMIAALRQGRVRADGQIEHPAPCDACGAKPGEVCVAIAGEIEPGEAHAAREVGRG